MDGGLLRCRPDVPRGPRRAACAGALALLFATHLGAEPGAARQVAQGQRAGSAPAPVQDFQVLPRRVDFGAVAAGTQAAEGLVLRNAAALPLTVTSVALLLGTSGTPRAFTLELGGASFAGDSTSITHPTGLTVAAGGRLAGRVLFAPIAKQYDAVVLRLAGDFGSRDVALTGLGGHEGDPYLHVAVQGPTHAIDYDADGVEMVTLHGGQSHTHEPGRSIVGWQWSEGGQLLGTAASLTRAFALGVHDGELRIEDDGTPPRSLTEEWRLDVRPINAVPGVLFTAFDAAGGNAALWVASPPPVPGFAAVLPELRVDGPRSVGPTPFREDVVVRLVADWNVPAAGTYAFALSGGAVQRIVLDGVVLTGPVALSAGPHRLDARVAVATVFDLPVELLATPAGGAPAAPDPARLSHDQSGLGPVVNRMPSAGIPAGGNRIVIEGLGFFPRAAVRVNWGAAVLTLADLRLVTETRIELDAPAGAEGTIQVSVQTPRGTSAALSYAYDQGGPVPLTFREAASVAVPRPTAGAWGADGRFYVTSLDGRLTALEFDQGWGLVDQTTYPGVSGLVNPDTLGLAVSPFDPPGGPVRLHVGHSKHYVRAGLGGAPYLGQVSVLEGPAFDQPLPLVTGLPSPNWDHGINGLEFDDDGDLHVLAGSSTNAGVRHPVSGDLPETPLSAAALLVQTSRPGFVGAVSYVDSLSGAPSTDQQDGLTAELAPGSDVRVSAAGLRNPYDLVYTTGGLLYATDNGPNVGGGAASLGPTSEAADPGEPDELLLLVDGGYYGHPNRCRGRDDPRQHVHRGRLTPTLPGEFTQRITDLPSSSDGIVEYRSDAFRGALRGDLCVQRFAGDLLRLELSPDGRFPERGSVLLPATGGLALETGPGGALLVLDYIGERLRVFEPVDASAVGLVLQDVTPWRAPAGGGVPFVLGGCGFGSLADTSVTFDGLPATLLGVEGRRIRGLVPAHPGPPGGLVDVAVTVAGATDVLERAFRFLPGPGLAPGIWEALPPAPAPLGPAAAAEVDGLLLAVEDGVAATHAFHLVHRLWMPPRAPRPRVGADHACVSFGGELFVLGGKGGGSAGTVQIYEPAGNAWRLGAPMPVPVSAAAAAVVGDMLYVAGGVSLNATVSSLQRYDPADDAWTVLASMPAGRNHAAAGTDGTRLFVFGGRTGNGALADGTGDVQVYDPATGAWTTSAQGGSGLAPLPFPRSDLGRAALLAGELYLIGGETVSGAGAGPGGTYARVDVFDPLLGTWRTETPLASARHGADAVLFDGSLHLVGGGPVAGPSSSSACEAFRLP